MGQHGTVSREPARPSNKGMKLTKPGQLRSFAAYPQCCADLRDATGEIPMARLVSCMALPAAFATSLLMACGVTDEALPPVKALVPAAEPSQPCALLPIVHDERPLLAAPIDPGKCLSSAELKRILVRDGDLATMRRRASLSRSGSQRLAVSRV